MEISTFLSKKTNFNSIYRPVIYNFSKNEDALGLKELMTTSPIQIFDTIQNQIAELIKIKHPGEKLSAGEMEEKIAEHLGTTPLDEYGVWVYYPWSQKLIHLVDEEEFVTIRTNRNIYKISQEEQKLLRKKRIGIIGLSVGQSIAVTMATERICGEMRLADFDTIELSNLNRLAVGVHDLGAPKVVVAARRIAEIDPFINIKCWLDGITETNIEEFLTQDGKIDVLAEECDSIQIKILSRIKAKELGIPVVMDTNDKGMLDIERFDLEKERGIFHGNIPELENFGFEALMNRLATLSAEEKFGILAKIIGFENISNEMKLSLSEMNKTIIAWPQIASAVNLGGALVTDVCRRIVLGKITGSGRYFIDLNSLVQ